MKILMIAPQPFFEPRGTPISVYQRAYGLSKLGHSVDLVTYHIGEDVNIPGIRIHRIPRIPWIKNLRVGPSWPKLPLDILLFFKSFGMLIKHRYDVIHSHEEAGIFSVVLAGLFRKRHLYDMHSSLPRQLVNFNFGNNRLIVKLFQIMERFTIGNCDAMITIGPDLEQHVRSLYPGVNEMMIENLPLKANSLDSDLLAVRKLKDKLGLDNRITIVYTGTFERYQGVNLLLESANRVRERYPNVAFVLVGGKPDQVRELQVEASHLQLGEVVRFTGTVSPEDANLYLDMADILVSPRIDGTSVPLKIYTYLRAGKPIVATNLPAHSLVLNEETAVLVAPEKEAFAGGLMRLIEDESLRQRLSQQTRKLAEEKYNMANYLSKLEAIYQRMCPALVAPEQPAHPVNN